MAFTQQACQLGVVEGFTGFSNMSLPCFSTKAFALLASIESSQGSCTSSLTWSSATCTIPVVLCPRRLARKSRWSPDHWFLNTNKPAPLDRASLKLAFNLLNASSLPRRCGSVTMIGCAIYWFLSRTTPSKRAGYRKAPRSLKRRGLGLDQTGRDRVLVWRFSAPHLVRTHRWAGRHSRLSCASVLPRSRNRLSAEEGGQVSPPDLGGPGRRAKHTGDVGQGRF